MPYIQLETILTKLCFLFLFLNMIYYCIGSNFFYTSKIHRYGLVGVGLANFCLAGLLLIRWVESNHFPLSNLYESLIFLAWSFTSIHLILYQITKNSILGLILTPITLLTNSFATFSLPTEIQKSTALVPALQSNWLMMHVTIMIVSYAALFSGSLLSIVYLILTFEQKKFLRLPTFWPPVQSYRTESSGLQEEQNPSTNVLRSKNSSSPFILKLVNFSSFSSAAKNFIPTSTRRGELPFPTPGPELTQNFEKMELETLASLRVLKSTLISPINQIEETIFIKKIDNLSYRILGIGFPLLTIGILSGSVWANEAWGSYWSWDPKETWAFITWLIFASYFHFRITKGWQGKKPAIIASIGFFLTWACYLGVNILGKGLHSYGWIS